MIGGQFFASRAIQKAQFEYSILAESQEAGWRFLPKAATDRSSVWEDFIGPLQFGQMSVPADQHKRIA